MRRTLEMLVGGWIVYVVVAACSGDAQRARSMSLTATSSPTTSSSLGGAGGATSSGAGAMGGRAYEPDAFADAVRDVFAEAEPSVTQVDDVPCAPLSTSEAGVQAMYAQKSYSGASQADLARVVALGLFAPSAGSTQLTGFQYIQAPALVRDGAVAVYCGNSNFPTYSIVRFVRPG